MRGYKKITLIRSRAGEMDSVNDALQWIGVSLGLVSLRDRDRSCFRIFIELLKMARLNSGLTSDELAEKLNLSRGTVVHHLNTLMERGIVSHVKNEYHLREKNLESLIDALNRDADSIWEELKRVSAYIDKFLNFR